MIEVKLPDYAQKTILEFIRDFAGEKKVIVGMSGGLDSSVVAKLCVMALGRERVLGVHMPDNVTPNEDTENAQNFAELLGIEYRVIPITTIVEMITNETKIKKRMSIANLKVRVRMSILYSLANELDALVAGTSNKSELLIGYFTKYGDGASDFAPIGDLYKTQVRILAEEIGIPEKILKKAPTAGLLPDQYDEEEIGMKYEVLDKILYALELGYSEERASEILDLNIDLVKKVYAMHENSRHKRILLYIPKIGIRTVNTDWRE